MRLPPILSAPDEIKPFPTSQNTVEYPVSITAATGMSGVWGFSLGEEVLFKETGFSFPAENECEEPENETENCENDINEEDFHTVSGGLATCTFNEFVDADENLITAQLREIEDIAAEINGGEEDEKEDNDDEEDAAKVPPIHTIALEALETLSDYFQLNSGSEATFSRLDELEKTF
ncbi:hypothetical protein AVEN_119563-1 [Araneus ventricosus]|uniref:Uncharacterized protein n=1 Tax=Araneus ventricosus TaxID=182803 RepID=A0A4Y2TDP7_ARAVE|nr:hypothetical protein AVEN_119563-1 [Araneus ventricosus]